VGYETERKLNVKVTEYMNEYLLANYACQVRSNPGTMDSLTAICNDANSWGADLFVSIHFNAGGGDGYEALVYNQKRVELGRIFERYVTEIGQNSRGVKLRPDLAVLKNTTMPAILNESAFVDHLQDITDWNEAAELQVLGEAYARAAADYLQLKEKGYTLPTFIRDVQAATGSVTDGIAGPETLGNTVTVSAYKNRTHPVVECVQKRLASLGYTQVGNPDGIAGAKFTQAVKAFQQDNGCVADGELTARNKTWRKLLELE
jgi:hypothetical protein